MRLIKNFMIDLLKYDLEGYIRITKRGKLQVSNTKDFKEFITITL